VKKILDVTCGGRMMWFDKKHPNAVYTDIRTEDRIELAGGNGRVLSVSPDIEADFRSLPFESETFYLVVFDPPHLKKLGLNTWMAQKYGVLFSTWEQDLRQGFDECMRVLKPNGTLIFKWNEHQVTLNQVLDLFPIKPLFGHTTGKHGKTIWVTFMKLT